jgi:hypothetical protein
VIEEALGLEHGFWGASPTGRRFKTLGRKRTPQGMTVITRHVADLDDAERRCERGVLPRGGAVSRHRSMQCSTRRWRSGERYRSTANWSASGRYAGLATAVGGRRVDGLGYVGRSGGPPGGGVGNKSRVAGFGQLADGLLEAGDWYRWGPYLSERQWGTVREDYSADGEAWAYFPHDHARSRRLPLAGEDGMAGFSDIEQRLCLAWRCGTATTPSSRSGCSDSPAPRATTARTQGLLVVPRCRAEPRVEPVALPLPAGGLPVRGAVEENARRGKHDPEYELLDTGAFDDDRYWVVEVDYVKADVDDS